jgi:hypothetical protein
MPAGLRLGMGVEAAAGNGHKGAHCTPGLWRLIDGLPRDCRPALLRGDSGIASGKTMREAESRGIAYLFQLRPAKNVKALTGRAFQKGGWHDAGQGWQGRTETLRLMGGSGSRRVTVLLYSALRRQAPTLPHAPSGSNGHSSVQARPFLRPCLCTH